MSSGMRYWGIGGRGLEGGGGGVMSHTLNNYYVIGSRVGSGQMWKTPTLLTQ